MYTSVTYFSVGDEVLGLLIIPSYLYYQDVYSAHVIFFLNEANCNKIEIYLYIIFYFM